MDIPKNAFSESQTASSTPKKLWEIYKDVVNWKEWDFEIEHSSIEGDFKNGSAGKLKSQGSPEVKFILSNVVENTSFRSESVIPLGRLVIDHFIEQNDKKVVFTHVVFFTGALAGLFNFLLGRGFRKSLPKVLLNLKNKLENN